MKTDRSRRSGTILAIALALLTVVLLLCAALTQKVLTFHRQARLEEHRHQAMWLMESGCQRAMRAASASADYQGETWNIPAEVLGTESSGTVVIRVDRQANPEPTISVEASYPHDGTQRFVTQREFSIGPPNRDPDLPTSS